MIEGVEARRRRRRFSLAVAVEVAGDGDEPAASERGEAAVFDGGSDEVKVLAERS